MKLETLAKELGLKLICGNLEHEYCGVYAGDLLSWVMSHVSRRNLWITIMSNINVIAIASLTEAAGVVLAEGTELSEDIKQIAAEKGVTILQSDMPTYELCVAIAEAEKRNESLL